MEPTRGAICRIYSGSPSREFVPYLEVRNVRKLDDPQGGTRYVMTMTDGDFVVKALVIPPSSLVLQIESGQVIVNTLLCLTDYRIEELNGSSFLLTNQARVMGTVPEHLRVPNERLQKWGARRDRQHLVHHRVYINACWSFPGQIVTSTCPAGLHIVHTCLFRRGPQRSRGSRCV